MKLCRICQFCTFAASLLLPLPGGENAESAEFVVNTTLDLPDAQPGDGVSDAGAGFSTLRSAIEEANALAGHDRIVFDIPPGGPATITVLEVLPAITDPVTIDGTTQPGFEGAPIVELTGGALVDPADGLTIIAGGSTVRGLVINLFPGSGVVLRGNGGNRVEGSYIGTDLTGRLPLGNELYGVWIDNSPENFVGGAEAAAGNLISGNQLGVVISGSPVFEERAAIGNVVLGNFIGTDLRGQIGLSLDQNIGVLIFRASGNTIGGAAPGARNVISGNFNRGIRLSFASDNRVEGNFIGTDVDGRLPLGNFVGVELLNASGNLIGGTDVTARNVIAGNSLVNVGITSGSARNVVQGNFIGTDVDGLTPLTLLDPDVEVYLFGQPLLERTAPLTVGLDVRFSDENLIGGTELGAGNVISGNGDTEVFIWAGRGNVVQGNFIGPDATGTAPVRKNAAQVQSFGVDVTGAPDTLIGGTEPGAGNVISGNFWGVALFGDIDGTLVQGNLIGTDAAGQKPLPNTLGMFVDSFALVTIGGPVAAARNVISGNTEDGIRIFNDPATVHGNFIGTDITGLLPLGNGGSGVFLDFASFDARIGGLQPGEGNVIAFNGGAGVQVGSPNPFFNQPNFTEGATIFSNSIFGNGGLGIDIEADGVTPNDELDADGGANNGQNYPVLTSARLVGGNAMIEGVLHSTPATAFTLQFFASREADPTGFGEGEQFLGTETVTTDAAGNAGFKAKFRPGTLAGPVITATATDPEGNTSEFSEAAVATGK